MTKEYNVILREHSDRRIQMRFFAALRMTKEYNVILREQSDRRI